MTYNDSVMIHCEHHSWSINLILDIAGIESRHSVSCLGLFSGTNLLDTAVIIQYHLPRDKMWMSAGGWEGAGGGF